MVHFTKNRFPVFESVVNISHDKITKSFIEGGFHMRRKSITILYMSLMTCMLFLCLKTTTVFAGQADDADITEIYEYKNDTGVNISYVLDSDKTMILRTSEKM